MTKEEIFNYFYTNSANLDVKSILTVMAAGLVIGALIYLTYFATYRGVAYNSRFNVSLVIILLVSIVIMLMISSNIVISLGMVGALSIVRYRTAVKDSRDTVFIFWAIAEGLSVGSQNFKLSIITTLFIGIFIIAASFIPYGRNKYLLVVCGGSEEINAAELDESIKNVARTVKLRSSNKDENHQEMIFEIKTKGELKADSVNAVSAVKGVTSVNWVVESGENVG